MTSALMIEILLKSALVAGAALGLVMWLKTLPAAQRAWIAHTGLLLTLLMPLFVIMGPDVELAGPWSRAVLQSVAVDAGAIMAVGSASPYLELSPAAASPSIDGRLIALAVWGLGAGGLLLGLAFGLTRLLRLQQDASVLTDRDWLGALAQAQHRMGVKQGTALLRSERVGSPISWGLLRPTIVLSPATLRTPENAEAILAHELAHVVRMDWLNLLVARLATAVFWFNPLVWLLAWQAHELREEAADDLVLRGDVSGTDYASLLVGLARDEQRLDLRRGTLAAHGVAPGKHSLRRRLVRVLDPEVRRDPTRPLWVAGCAAAATLIAAPLAAFTPVDRVIGGARPTAASYIARPAATGGAAAASVVPAGVAVAPFAKGVFDSVTHPGIDLEPGPQVVGGFGDQAPQPDPGAPAGRLSPEMVAQMRISGVTPEWIAGLEAEVPGIRRLSAQELAFLALYRVSPGWVRSMREAGYGNLSYEQMRSLAMFRVTPAYIRELESAGYRDLSVEQLVALRIGRVDAGYIRQMEAEGLRSGPDPAGREQIATGVRQRPLPAGGEPPAPPPPPAHATPFS